MNAMKMAKKDEAVLAPKPMKAMNTMKAMKMAKTDAAVLAPKAMKAGHSKRGEYSSTWIHVNTEGCKACLVEAWTTTNDDVYYKVYKMI